jgi:hypothetical protein
MYQRHHYDIGCLDLVKEGNNRSAVWDVVDWQNVSKEFATIRSLVFMENVFRKRDPAISEEYRILKSNLLLEWENNIDRIWNDKKTGTFFHNGIKFEPIITVKVNNKVLWDGTRLFNQFCVGQSEDFFQWFALGDSRTETDLSMQTLINEIARANMNRDGIHTADGNVIKYAVQFGPSVPDVIVREFGGFNDESAGDQCFRATLPDDTLEHRQGDTFVTANHNIVTSPR